MVPSELLVFMLEELHLLRTRAQDCVDFLFVEHLFSHLNPLPRREHGLLLIKLGV